MNKKILSFLKKQWLLVWCIVMAVSLFSMIAYAEYEVTTNSMKKVVRSTSDQGKMFSSNILVENGGSSYFPNYKPKLTTEQLTAGNTYDVDVYLWNYSLSNIYKYYPSAIDYSIQLSFTNTNGTALTSLPAGRSVSLYKGTATVPLLTLDSLTPVSTSPLPENKQTLGNDSSESAEDHYILKFSGNWDLNNETDICVKMEAIPYNGGVTTKYQDLSPLSAVIGLKESVDLGSSGWDAYISEGKLTDLTIGDFDAFNLVVTGSGKAQITIKWDITKIECNKNFYKGLIYTFGRYVNSDTTTTQEIAYTPATAEAAGTYTVTRTGESGNYTYTYTKSNGSVFPTSGDYTWQLNDGTPGTYSDFETALTSADFNDTVTVTVASTSSTGNIATLVLNCDTNTPLYSDLVYLGLPSDYFTYRGIYTVTRSGESGSYIYSYTKNGNSASIPTSGEYTWQLNDGTPGTYSEFQIALAGADFDNEVTLTIAAAAETLENRNRYDLQFYKKGTDPSSFGFCSVTETGLPTDPSGDVWLTVHVEKQ